VTSWSGPNPASGESSPTYGPPPARRLTWAPGLLETGLSPTRRATGATLWTKRYDNAHELDGASSVAVSPDGRRVFVTGGSRGRKFGADFATVAYAAATGAPLWARRYHAPGDRNDTRGKVLVSPRSGGTVVVSGDSSAGGNVSVAYSAVTGRTMWVSRFHQNGFQQEFLAADAISPDGRNFYLTGLGFVVPGGEEPATAFFHGRREGRHGRPELG
jgi:outer membrane protein assembly factor BamB